MKALVIDDSRAMRAIIKRSLESAGHVVVEAIDGQHGIDQLTANGPFDLALVDWNMPVMNGFEFVCTVRADNRYAGMKLMMVTTEIEMAQIAKALEAGANEYLMKPFTAPALQEKVEMLMAA